MKRKALAEFQICISVPLRLIFDHPPKWWQSGRKEGKKTERQHFKENSSYRANICIGSEYEIIVFWLQFLHNLIVFIISSSGFICFQNWGHANASQRQKINFHSRPLFLNSFLSKHLLVLKTSSRHILKTTSTRLQRNNFSSSRRLGGKQNVYWGYLYLTNLNVYLTNLYLTNLYLTNLRWIQNVLLRTQ